MLFMHTMKSLVSIAGILAAIPACGEPVELPLWPTGSPATQPLAVAESIVERGKGHPDRSIKNVSYPTLTVYRPDHDANGAVVIICPGGGYGSLAIDKEGHDVARWLNTFGVTGIVLKYRLPHPEITGDQIPWPIRDGQRAVRLTRLKAMEWKIDPRRVGMMGFSAGGHLVSAAATRFDAGDPHAQDPIDRFSSRPDIVMLVYPVISLQEPIAHKGSRSALLGEHPDERRVEYYSNELQVTAHSPPAFLVQARDDGVNVENSIRFAAAMKKAGVPCELQLYEKGGHGYGLGIRGGEIAGWPAKCQAWMKELNFLGPTP